MKNRARGVLPSMPTSFPLIRLMDIETRVRPAGPDRQDHRRIPRILAAAQGDRPEGCRTPRTPTPGNGGFAVADGPRENH